MRPVTTAIAGWTRPRVELEALITAASNCRDAADRGMVFDSLPFADLAKAVSAMFDFDPMWDLAKDIEFEASKGGRA